MNKAFVRESDAENDACPACGSRGVAVSSVTLDAQFEATARRQLADSAFYCPLASCVVAYFDVFERSVPTTALLRPAWPKSAEAPLCACFGLTLADVEQDVAEGGVRRVREVIERSKSTEAHCQRAAASGQSCVAEVQRCYLRLRGGSAP
jgi:Zinc binding domain